jgi:hypothetical protein
VSSTATEQQPTDTIAWQNLQNAILQERFDDLPELIAARDFAAFSDEPIELIRDAITSGDIVATRADGFVAIPKDANERLIRYRLLEDTTARIVERPAVPSVTQLSTHVDQSVFELVSGLASGSGATMRELVEEALLAYWGAGAPDGVPSAGPPR